MGPSRSGAGSPRPGGLPRNRSRRWPAWWPNSSGASAVKGERRRGDPRRDLAGSGLVKNANSTWLNGRPLRSDLEERLGHPVRLANDANCFALSEAIDGAGGGSGHRLRCDPRNRRRRGARRRRRRPDRGQRDRRRVGAQSPPLAGRRRDPGPVLLVRPLRLHRALALRPRPRGRSRPRHRGDSPAEAIAGAALAGDPTRWRAWPATRTGWRARSPR